MGRARRTVFPAAITGIALLTLSACMMGPFDEKRVPDRTSTIQFWGGHLAPNAGVTIEAFDPVAKSWDAIGNTTSSQFQFPVLGGATKLHYWGTGLVVASKYWERAGVSDGNDYRAKVRANSGGIKHISVLEDAGSCSLKSSSVQNFINECSSPDSPIATVHALCPPANDVTYVGDSCSAAVQADLEADMSVVYDNLFGVGSIGGCLDASPVRDLRNRMLDYLTCKPLEITCDDPRCNDTPGRMGFVDPDEYSAGLRRFNICPSKFTPGFSEAILVAHELTHLAELDTQGFTSEQRAPTIGVNCGSQ